MSRILKKGDVYSTSGHKHTFRIFSVAVNPWSPKKNREYELRLTLDSKNHNNKYWNIPFKEMSKEGNIRTYCDFYDSFINISNASVKAFLDSYKSGLWSGKNEQ